MQTHYYYHTKPLDEEADRLLTILARDNYPHFTNPTFKRKLLRSRARERYRFVAPAPVEEAVAFLQRSTLASIIAAARLTRRQAEVLDARAEGATWDEIGRRFRQSKQGARRVFLQAVGKVRNAWRLSSMVGIDEVYRSEVRRRGLNRR
jgi:hypothetical protein